MLASVARHAPAIIAGSALAGFGLSFGRDAYKKAKENWPIIAVLVCLVGVFFASMWLFRNYRTATGSLFKKLGALIILVGLGGVYASAIVFLVISTGAGPEQSGAEDGNTLFHNLVESTWFYIGFALYGIMFVAGALWGIKHRGKRRQAWEAETHNAAFLNEQGLETVDADDKGNLRLRDTVNGIGYRLSEDLNAAGELEFTALGKRNKRGYIQYDETGKFVSWSGLVDAY